MLKYTREPRLTKANQNHAAYQKHSLLPHTPTSQPVQQEDTPPPNRSEKGGEKRTDSTTAPWKAIAVATAENEQPVKQISQKNSTATPKTTWTPPHRKLSPTQTQQDGYRKMQSLGFQTHSKKKQGGIWNLYIDQRHESTFISSPTPSLKILLFLFFHKTQIVACQTSHNPFFNHFLLATPLQQAQWINRFGGLTKLKFHHVITLDHTPQAKSQWSKILKNRK